MQFSGVCLNPTLDWICALTFSSSFWRRNWHTVLILLWTGYVLWREITNAQQLEQEIVLILLWTGYVLWLSKKVWQVNIYAVLILLWTGYVLWLGEIEIKEVSGSVLILLWTGYVLWPSIIIWWCNWPRSLNPTLDWICALTFHSPCCSRKQPFRLNPTLDWICALTVFPKTETELRIAVLILLWTGYVLWPNKQAQTK